jgi:hypothetical protein
MYVANMSAMYVHRMIMNGRIETYNCKHPPSALKRTKDRYELLSYKLVHRETKDVTWEVCAKGSDVHAFAPTEAQAVHMWCEIAKLPYLTKAFQEKQQTQN